MSAVFGLMAEFRGPAELMKAARSAHAKGFRHMDAYSPFPVEGLSEALGSRHTNIPLYVLLGGIVGGVGGFFMQYYAAAIGYPINIGGRPLNSWPAFIPIMFELTILVAGLTAAIAMITMSGLPQPYHPVFNAPGFERATSDRFFLCIEASDPAFDVEATRGFLEELKPERITVVDD